MAGGCVVCDEAGPAPGTWAKVATCRASITLGCLQQGAPAGGGGQVNTHKAEEQATHARRDEAGRAQVSFPFCPAMLVLSPAEDFLEGRTVWVAFDHTWREALGTSKPSQSEGSNYQTP